MNIQKPKSTKKILIIAGIVIALVAGYTATAWKLSLWPFMNTTNLGPVSQDEKKTGDQIKSNSVKESTKDEGSSSGSDQPLAPVQNPETNTSTVLVDISADSQNGSVYQLRVLIQAVLGSGECTITVEKEKGDQTYTASAPIQPMSTSSTCAGFDIPVSKLGVGKWTATINVSSGSHTGSASKEIEVK
jgi:hypothetical protein